MQYALILPADLRYFRFRAGSGLDFIRPFAIMHSIYVLDRPFYHACFDSGSC
jgi:hypothetical protein